MLRPILGLAVLLTSCSGEPEPPPPAVPDAAAVEPAAADRAPVAVVQSVDGELLSNGQPLKVGDPVTIDGELEVRRGRAVIAIPGVGTVRVYPKTRLRVVQRSKVRLLLGKVWAAVQGVEKSGFAVETENAVAGVRGTELIVERTPAMTRVTVAHGKVSVRATAVPDAEVVLAQGEVTEVRGSAPPTERAPVDVALEEQQWETSAETADAAPGEAGGDEPAAPAEPERPDPKVKVDRKAFEKHEQEGAEQKKALEQEAAQQKKELDAEEQHERENMKKGGEDVEKDLERDMGNDAKLKPRKGTLKPKEGSPPHDDEVKDFLR